MLGNSCESFDHACAALRTNTEISCEIIFKGIFSILQLIYSISYYQFISSWNIGFEGGKGVGKERDHF